MSGSYYALNAKYNSLLSKVLALTGGGGLTAVLTANDDAGGLDITNLNNINLTTINGLPPAGAENLEQTLTIGNSAGTNDINMNSQDILAVNNINLTTINSAAYPPLVADNTLTEVLTAGNDAGGLSITGVNDIALTTINSAAYPPVVAADDFTAVLTAGNTATGASATISLDNGGNVASLTTTDLTFNGVSIRPIQFASSAVPFSVSGTPNNIIFASTGISPMTANTVWKVDVGFYASVVSARNLLTYIVSDGAALKVERRTVFGFNDGGFQTAIVPNVPAPIGTYCSFTDTFKVDAGAVGSCRFNLTGGTSDGSTWTGNCNLSIVLTRLF